MIDLIGYLAAFCTSLAFVPQAIKVIRSKDTKALSLAMYSVLTFGVSMWLIYGLLINDWPIILANLVTLTFACLILAMKYRNREADKAN